MRPVWLGDELLLVRRVNFDGQDVIQCCWLAWDEIQNALRKEVDDIIPDIEFQPVSDEKALIPGRALVTLPVEFNASARAKKLVVEAGIVGPLEREGIDKVLGAAAMTYVAAFVTSLLTLLYFLHRAGLLGGNRHR